MRLSKQDTNTIYPRCLDRASSATPRYQMKLYNRLSDVLLTMNLTDTSTNTTAYQVFAITPWMLQIAPGTYKYQIVDADDDEKVLDTGRVTITDTNHTTESHGITDNHYAHAVE